MSSVEPAASGAGAAGSPCLFADLLASVRDGLPGDQAAVFSEHLTEESLADIALAAVIAVVSAHIDELRDEVRARVLDALPRP